MLHNIFETKMDVFVQFELGGKNLGKLLSEMKGEFIKTERIYKVVHGPLYKNLQKSPRLFRSLVREILKGLDALHCAQIVHSDLKPENILLQLNEEATEILECKLIDFGSMIQTDCWESLQITTPEYMPPEILGTKLRSKMGEKYRSCLWALDIWSLGALVVEIVSGIPIWINLKCKIERKGKMVDGYGLFSSKGRDPGKIIGLQKAMAADLKTKIGPFCFEWMDKDLFIDFLGGMLALTPSKRLSPKALLSHAFLCEETPFSQEEKSLRPEQDVRPEGVAIERQGAEKEKREGKSFLLSPPKDFL